MNELFLVNKLYINILSALGGLELGRAYGTKALRCPSKTSSNDYRRILKNTGKALEKSMAAVPFLPLYTHLFYIKYKTEKQKQ